MLSLLLSALAVALLTALAWAVGFRSAPVLDEAGAAAEAEGRLAGFRTAMVVLAEGGRGALLRGVDGTLALLLPLGDGWLPRLVPPGALRLDGRHVRVRLGEPMLSEAELLLAERPAWLEGAA
jgi:hypothetical protein